MKLWTLWVQEPDCLGTWIEAAWDDEMTAENRQGWEAEVDRVRKLVSENPGYEMRTIIVEFPDRAVFGAFEFPEVTATAQEYTDAS
jgi:hypothetical protein